MADLGKIAVTDGGNYSASTTYEKLTFVHYQGDAYMTLKTVKGVTPTDDGVNYRRFCKSAELATASKAGIVMPDGTTTTVDSSGYLSAKKATQSTTGIVKGSNSIKVGSDGAIDVNTTFTQAVNLANIITGEAIATILGKVSKAIATTMNLNQNALLKSMLTSIDANDSSKIPTAAYIHTLVERIGMGTQLTDGANLTEAANNLNSNLKVGTTTVLVSGQAGAIRTSNIIFDTSFSKMPSISVAIYNEYPSVFQATISKVTKLGFSLYLETIRETSEQSVLVHWIASAK
nr:MAG TPA: H-type lectin domain [Caudoviricetes sp.]